MHISAYVFSIQYSGEIANGVHVENVDRQVVVLCHGYGAEVHHSQSSTKHFVIAYLVELSCRGVFLRIGCIYAVNTRTFQHYVGFDFYASEGAACIGSEIGIACAGGEPLFFLDYIACGKNVPEKIADIVKGVCEGCVQSGAALIGGETAEMPGFYPEDEYDLAGYCTGIVDKDRIIDNTKMAQGDTVIALASSGVHSNGFSLVRKVFDIENADLSSPVSELGGKSLGEALLEPTKIYVKPVLALIKEIEVKGISHITGGGFYENIPRSIPDGLGAKIDGSKVRVLPIFDLIAKTGNISERDMFNTYNMGVGMSIVVKKEDTDKALEILRANGEDAYIIGEIVKSEEKIAIC